MNTPKWPTIAAMFICWTGLCFMVGFIANAVIGANAQDAYMDLVRQYEAAEEKKAEVMLFEENIARINERNKDTSFDSWLEEDRKDYKRLMLAVADKQAAYVMLVNDYNKAMAKANGFYSYVCMPGKRRLPLKITG